MKKILFPTDFSSAAQNAFKYALHVAEELGAIIDLMSVYHLPITDAGSTPPDYIEKMLQDKRNKVKDQLKLFTKEAPNALIGKTRADYGLFVAQEIIDAAKYCEYDLIIMGTKGEHNRLEKLLGSVTTNVMMQAECPVMAVPEEAQFMGIHEIAYATDFQPSDELAIHQLTTFSKTFNANVHFVHVETKAAVGTVDDYFQTGIFSDSFTDFTIVNDHSIVNGLDQYVKTNEIDLIALFIPKRRLWERLFHNSISKKMTFHAKVPLLAFHE